MSAADLPASSLLGGRYRLVERLGAGGMSVVWRGFDEVLGRQVAVKVLPTGSGADPVFRRRLRTEAQAAARLSHPHITNVYDYGESPAAGGAAVPYVVMELVDGEPLSAVLARRRLLPWPAAVRTCAEVAAALSAAHARGIVHRDIAPANVMLTAAGAKVVDFGISALVGENDLDADGSLLGTPAYLAPERLEGGQVSPATDVYAVGLLLYRMLTGTLPWDAGTTTALLRAHQYTEPEPLPPIDGLPEAVAEACGRSLSKQPHERPSSSELARLLIRVAQGAPATPLPLITPASADTGGHTTILPWRVDASDLVVGGSDENAPVPAAPVSAVPVSAAPVPAVPAAAAGAASGRVAMPAAPGDLAGRAAAAAHGVRRTGPGAAPAAHGSASYGSALHGSGIHGSAAQGSAVDGSAAGLALRAASGGLAVLAPGSSTGDRVGGPGPATGASGSSNGDGTGASGSSNGDGADASTGDRVPAGGSTGDVAAPAPADAPRIPAQRRPDDTDPPAAPPVGAVPGAAGPPRTVKLLVAAGAVVAVGAAAFAWNWWDAAGERGTADQAAAVRPSACVVTWAIQKQDADTFEADVTVQNRTATPVDRWQLNFALPGDQLITSDDMTVRQDGRNVAARSSAPIEPGGSVTATVLGVYARSNALPSSFALNNSVCEVYLAAEPGAKPQLVPAPVGGGVQAAGAVGAGAVGAGAVGGGPVGGGAVGGGAVGGDGGGGVPGQAGAPGQAGPPGVPGLPGPGNGGVVPPGGVQPTTGGGGPAPTAGPPTQGPGPQPSATSPTEDTLTDKEAREKLKELRASKKAEEKAAKAAEKAAEKAGKGKGATSAVEVPVGAP
jgi:serine/threonine-protein kinase